MYTLIAGTQSHDGIAEGQIDPPFELKTVELWVLKRAMITEAEHTRREKKRQAAEERRRRAGYGYLELILGMPLAEAKKVREFLSCDPEDKPEEAACDLKTSERERSAKVAFDKGRIIVITVVFDPGFSTNHDLLAKK
ncbi:MAG: hypothetical protein IPG96_07680, partial [Proteobacteria bacterium]|nr:hypothetical protein [Pseudomonadota bacterium]